MTNPNEPIAPTTDAAHYETMGLTKREYMATHILAGLAKLDTSLTPVEVAKEAVELTDALMAVLNIGTDKTKADYDAEKPW